MSSVDISTNPIFAALNKIASGWLLKIERKKFTVSP